MTLNEWLARTTCYARIHPSGAICVYDAHQQSPEAKWSLYHLADYVVSSVSGPVTWMVRR